MDTLNQNSKDKALIEWNELYALGIDAIDQQHKKLIDIINALYTSIAEGETMTALNSIIDDLLNYTQTHFTYEEAYFEKFHFQDSEVHTMEHNRFIDELSSFQTKVREGDLVVSMRMLKFLRNWLFSHILETDQKYVACFQENGLA